MEEIPTYQSIQREDHLTQLIPGDRVRVKLEHHPEYMVYAGMDHGQGNSSLNPYSSILFITVPALYDGQAVPFSAWRSLVKYLQFGNDCVYFSSMHTNVDKISPEDQQYGTIKNLVDMLR